MKRKTTSSGIKVTEKADAVNSVVFTTLESKHGNLAPGMTQLAQILLTVVATL